MPTDHSYVLSVMSDDHPGIVAEVTDAIRQLDGNIVSCSQTVLSGYFTLIMIASFPEARDADQLVTSIQGTDPSCQVLARPFQPRQADERQLQRFVVTAFGQDRPGIIQRFTQYMSDKDINIVDLFGYKQQDDFVLITQVDVPANWSVRMIQADLHEMGEEEGFTVRFQHENVFVATNQLRLTTSQA